MSVSLYLSGEGIQVVEGGSRGDRIWANRTLTVDLPPQVLENGTVTDEKTFVKTMKAFWKENELPKKDVVLVLYNKLLTTKMIDVPAASDRITYELVKREMASYEEDAEPVYAWHVVKKADKGELKEARRLREKEERRARKRKKKRKDIPEFLYEDEPEDAQEGRQGNLNRLLAARIEAEELKRYVTLLGYAGIPVSNACSALVSLVSSLSALEDVSSGTCIVSFQGENHHINLLFLNGVYHSSMTRAALEEKGTIGYAIEEARSISGMLQFIKANDLEYEDDMKVFLLGMDPEDVLNCSESILQMNSSLTVEELKADDLTETAGKEAADLNDYILAAAGLFPLGRKEDLYASYEKMLWDNGKKKKIVRGILPAAVAAAILLVVTAVLGVLDVRTGLKYKAAKEYNESCLEASMYYDVALEETIGFEDKYSALEEIREKLDSYPHANSSVEKIVVRTASKYVDAEVESYDASEGLYNLKTTAKDVEKISQCIDSLKRLDLFVDVNYTGYTYEEETGEWQVNVLCYLAGTAGKEE